MSIPDPANAGHKFCLQGCGGKVEGINTGVLLATGLLRGTL